MVKKEAVKSFPSGPGVYLMKDAEGRVIYVGKALSLKKRVRSYFLKGRLSLKNDVMMGYAASIGFIKTPTEHDALILEDRLIKQYQPRFNIIAKDDKTFPYIKVTREEFPRVFIGRRKKNEDVDYFGPYTGARLLRRALAILRKSFPFCSCRRFPKRPCLNYDLKLCPGPCQGKIAKPAYLKIIRAFEDFLAQRDTDLIEGLSRRMRDLVREERFEDAAKLRDQLEALSILNTLKKTGTRQAPDIDRDLARLGLGKEPRRIEAFDISNISGSLAVGSMVSFYNGVPDKDNYRRFRIRRVSGIDDYAMMREVVRRRYERLTREGRSLPDLIVIDGGRGHLEAAAAVLKGLQVSAPVISIAKKEELVYTMRQTRPIALGQDSPLLMLIQRLRDEAHRFALKYHRLLRHKNAFGKE